jgi:uncharacterized protein
MVSSTLSSTVSTRRFATLIFATLCCAILTLSSTTLAFTSQHAIHHSTSRLTSRIATTRQASAIPNSIRKCHHYHGSSQLNFAPSTHSHLRKHSPTQTSSLALFQSSDPNDTDSNQPFDPRFTLSLILGQSALILVAVVVALVLGTPAVGLGNNFELDGSAVLYGSLLTLPLGVMAAVLDKVEDRFPALQDVSKATLRSVLALLGGSFKPLIGIVVATALGLAAGIGEEWVFRGVFQYELTTRLGPPVALLLSSIVFGLLHAVTPLYAFLATLASLYFGGLFWSFDNLAVPMACHTVYDILALYYAHWTVTRMSQAEQDSIANWAGPTKR